MKPNNSNTMKDQIKKQIEVILNDPCPGVSLEKQIARSIQAIDSFFGEGFAKDHPDLLGRCIQAEAQNDTCHGNIEDAIKEIATAISYFPRGT